MNWTQWWEVKMIDLSIALPIIFIGILLLVVYEVFKKED